MKLILRWIAITVMLTPLSALANSWSCTYNDLVRTITIETEPGSTACKVNYTKETEGVAMQTLWNAANDTTFCTEKAEGLVEKLTSAGWNCTKAEAAAEPMVETEPVEAEPEPAEPAEPAEPVEPAAPVM